MTSSPSTTTRATPGRPAGRRHAVFHRLRVAEVEQLTDDAVAIAFEVPQELRDAYEYRPGQHLTIRHTFVGEPGPEEVRRNYSICGAAGEVGRTGRLRVAVKRLGGGRFSDFAVSQVRPGDEFDVMTPTGRFCVDVEPAAARHLVAVAAGSGITPILSILASVLDGEPQSSCTLLYGNRTTSSIMFLDELADLKDRHPARFQLVNVLSRESHEVELFHGRIDGDRLSTLLARLVPPDEVDGWLLCGPYAMVEELRETLLDHGVEPRRIHVELYHVEGEAPRPARSETPDTRDGRAPGASNVSVVLDGRSTTFDLPQDGEPILDAALRRRGDAPYACKSAVCGTCRAKLVEGTVRMDRNHALEADEVDDGFVLTCQSHPTSDRVVVDYDQ